MVMAHIAAADIVMIYVVMAYKVTAMTADGSALCNESRSSWSRRIGDERTDLVCFRKQSVREVGFGKLAREAWGNRGQIPAGGTGGATVWTLHIENNSKNPYEQSSVREL